MAEGGNGGSAALHKLFYRIGEVASILGEETRDMRFVIGQVMPVWYLLTPILYPLSSVPEHWRTWMILNPMTGVVETFKYAALGEGQPAYGPLAIAAGEALFILCVGMWFFARRDAAAASARNAGTRSPPTFRVSAATSAAARNTTASARPDVKRAARIMPPILLRAWGILPVCRLRSSASSWAATLTSRS